MDCAFQITQIVQNNKRVSYGALSTLIMFYKGHSYLTTSLKILDFDCRPLKLSLSFPKISITGFVAFFWLGLVFVWFYYHIRWKWNGWKCISCCGYWSDGLGMR